MLLGFSFPWILGYGLFVIRNGVALLAPRELPKPKKNDYASGIYLYMSPSFNRIEYMALTSISRSKFLGNY